MHGDDTNDHQPVTWLRGYPLYTAHIIVLVYIASLFATSILMLVKADGVFAWLAFSSEGVLKRGELWRLATYGLLNAPSLWFVVDMFMIGLFGRELEKFLGRRVFLRFYACSYFLKPLLFTLLGLWWPLQMAGQAGALALFIAFATLYPNVPILFTLLSKWVAVILVGIYTLIALAQRDLTGLALLWVTAGFAFAFVRHEQGHFALPKIKLPLRRSSSPAPARPKTRPATIMTKETKAESMVEMDALLDKIARSGLSSLTAKERTQLDAARENLLKNREAGRR